jgi:acetolactate synthase-1/3 small subunit
MMKHTISVLVENKFGVLARISGLFSGRGFNIDSLAVGETQDPTVSRMTIVVQGDDLVLEQVVKQLNKLIDVIKVIDMKGKARVERELVLAKVAANAKARSEIMQIVDIFRAKIVDVSHEAMTIEITGDEAKINGFFDLMKTFGIQEVARTGKVALLRE